MQFQILIYKLFRLIIKPFLGKGWGRYSIIGVPYRWLSGILIPTSQREVDVNGYKILVHTEKYKGIDGISQQLLFEGTYEPVTTGIFKKIVKSGMNVIDVGANIGYFTLLGASIVGEKGSVFAFEPEPRNYEMLVNNIKLNNFNNVRAFNKAVSDRNGTINLFVNEVEPGAHSILPVRDSSQKQVLVEMVNLDNLIKEYGCLIDIIKVDVEGAEILVLSGMQEIIKANDNLVLFTELWPSGLIKAGYEPAIYWDNLKKSGFTHIYYINEKDKSLEDGDLQKIMKQCQAGLSKEGSSVNLLCSKNPIEISH